MSDLPYLLGLSAEKMPVHCDAGRREGSRLSSLIFKLDTVGFDQCRKRAQRSEIAERDGRERDRERKSKREKRREQERASGRGNRSGWGPAETRGPD